MNGAYAYQGPTCNWCGAGLTRSQSATTQSCGAATCKQQRMVVLARSETQRHCDDHDQLVTRMRSACADALNTAASSFGMNASELQIAVVPYNGKSLTPLSADRRAAFEAHLRKIAEVGFRIERPEIHASKYVRSKIDLPEARVTDAACATCMGDCCKAGRPSWGFTDETTVCRYRVAHPEADIQAFCAYYLDHLPTRSVEGNCVFQSDSGCTLNRKDRADLCNSFLCRGVTRIQEEHTRRGAGFTAIIAQHEGTPKAVRLFDVEADRLSKVLPNGPEQ